jgi:DNA-binding transcriptional ArsR family regulator
VTACRTVRLRACRRVPPPRSGHPLLPFNQVVDNWGRSFIINHMVESRLDRVFHALASAPRREILRRTARKRWTVTALAEHFDMSLAAVSKHVRVLDEAGLLSRQDDGRLKWRRMNPKELEPAMACLEELRVFWGKQLDQLESFLSKKR